MKYPLIILLLLMFTQASAGTPHHAASAPPRKCEIRQSAWCIQQGSFEIDIRTPSDGVHDRKWVLRGQFLSTSELTVLEPNGCRSGVSDTLRLIKSEIHQVTSMDTQELIVRLKTDGSCDLVVSYPMLDSHPLEWAFRTGLTFIQACENERCTGPNLGELKDQIARSSPQSK
jgi:hypothetical protein